MAIEVKIPAVGESITSGIVSVWHKKSGDFVNAGDALFTLETDKVSTEIAAEISGVLDTIVPEGQEVKIGEVVATIDDSKKAPAAKPAEEKAAAKSETKTAAPPKEKSADAKAASPARTLSPAVRRIVDEEHLNPEKISGTGPGGRLTKADALTAAQNRGASEKKIDIEPATAGPSVGGQLSDGRVVRKKMSPFWRKIAAEVGMGPHTAAILTTINEWDIR